MFRKLIMKVNVLRRSKGFKTYFLYPNADNKETRVLTDGNVDFRFLCEVIDNRLCFVNRTHIHVPQFMY